MIQNRITVKEMKLPRREMDQTRIDREINKTIRKRVELEPPVKGLRKNSTEHINRMSKISLTRNVLHA